VSVYCWLVGLAQFLLQTASPVFCATLLLIGAAAMPVWWRVVRSA
jgi:hypothetical protein